MALYSRLNLYIYFNYNKLRVKNQNKNNTNEDDLPIINIRHKPCHLSENIDI